MDFSPRGIVTPLQSAVLAAFFSRTQGFFLSGGTALAEFYLGHRDSQDLALFTTDDEAFSRAPVWLAAAARDAGANLASLQVTPAFHRYSLEKGEERFLVDLVRDPAYQAVLDKPSWKGIRVDSIQDITSNKLRTVLSRSDLKDHVDLFFLSRAGISLDAALPDAERKDGGISKAMLAYLMSQMRVAKIPACLRLPLSLEESRAFFGDLSRRRAWESAPPQSNSP